MSVAARGTWQSSGQNCAGCERLLVHESVYEACLAKLTAVARSLRQGPPLGDDPAAVDAGALALPGLAQNIAALVDDAVSHGAKVALPCCRAGSMTSRHVTASILMSA